MGDQLQNMDKTILDNWLQLRVDYRRGTILSVYGFDMDPDQRISATWLRIRILLFSGFPGPDKDPYKLGIRNQIRCEAQNYGPGSVTRSNKQRYFMPPWYSTYFNILIVSALDGCDADVVIK